MMRGTGITIDARGEVMSAQIGCYACREVTETKDGDVIRRWAASHRAPWWLPRFSPGRDRRFWRRIV